jgi:3-dehydroquinate synthetase
MIDASVGGKTGVDVHAGKNLVGAFHAPRAVLADTRVLSTLPREERAQGLVEALKHGAILDEEYFSLLSERLPALLDGDPDAASAAVLRSVELKATVVGQDEVEGGYRQILNFGHTIGHAIEAASNYTVGHGTAVALGMMAEAAIGERIGITDAGTCDRLERALHPLLPGQTGGVQSEEALGFLRTDKKARRGRPRFVLLKGIGEVDRGEEWSQEVSSEVVSDAMNRVLDRS